MIWEFFARVRGLRWLLPLLASLLLAACSLPTLVQRQPELPVPLTDLMPADWQAINDQRGRPMNAAPVNLDEDKESEWLIFYHYDNPPGGAGPVGGIIYDTQKDAEIYNSPGTVPFPYQPSAFLVPYRLLPDWRYRKGQGYLADSRVTWREVDSDGQAGNDELVVSGYGPGGLTRLSIFWWEKAEAGYAVSHFAGSHSVRANTEGVINEVTTLDRLYERSNLCRRVVHQRVEKTHYFTAGPPALVFCQGVPAEPAYPEAVVLAWLLNEDPKLLQAESQLDRLFSNKPVRRVISLTYAGEAQREGQGQEAQSQVIVRSEVETSAGRERHWWRLVESRPLKPSDSSEIEVTTRWRIESAGLMP